MRPRRLLVPLALLVAAAAPSAAAAVDLGLPDSFQLSQATFLAGHITLSGEPVLRDAVVAGPRLMAWSGTLTVCPEVFASQGVVRPVLLDALGTLGSDCDGGETYAEPVLAFGPGTRLGFGGNLSIAAMPAAAFLAPFADGSAAMTIGGQREPLRLAPEDGRAAFASLSAASSVAVLPQNGDPIYYNGTSYAFLVESDALPLDAAALAAAWDGPLAATVTPAQREDLEDAFSDPFALLDAQEALLGPDAREPRGNVSAVLREFGRVPAFVNGALLGRLDGHVSGGTFHQEIGLARGDSFSLERNGDRLTGTDDPRVTLSSDGVSFQGGPARDAPWFWAILFWVAALVVLAVRRHAPLRPWWISLAWGVALAAAFLLLDLLVFQADFGTGVLNEARHRAHPGTLLSLLTFELVLLAASFLAIAWPGRLLLGRLVPQRFLPAAEGVWALVWVLLPVVFPASFFALGYALARL